MDQTEAEILSIEEKVEVKTWNNISYFIITLSLANIIVSIVSKNVLGYLDSNGILKWYYSFGGESAYYFIINLVNGGLTGLLYGTALAITLKKIKKDLPTNKMILTFLISIMIGYLGQGFMNLHAIAIQFCVGVGLYLCVKKIKPEMTMNQVVLLLGTPLISNTITKKLLNIIYVNFLPQNNMMGLNLSGQIVNSLFYGVLYGLFLGYILLSILDDAIFA